MGAEPPVLQARPATLAVRDDSPILRSRWITDRCLARHGEGHRSESRGRGESGFARINNLCMDYAASHATHLRGTPLRGSQQSLYRRPGGFAATAKIKLTLVR
jgi:hypothetical protein